MSTSLLTVDEALQAMTLSTPAPASAPATAASPAAFVASGISTDWRRELPTIVGKGLTLRGLRLSDAASLLAMLSTDEVARFLSPPPTTIEGFERFIKWTDRKRQEGSYVCFAVVPAGMDLAVGFFQVRALDADFRTAEWGFALGKAFWGTGLFVEGATHTLDFTFGTLGVSRLEARAAVRNGRGNGALRKIGAMHEAVLRRSFHRSGEAHDQALWSILDVDWLAIRGRTFEQELRLPQRWH
jgi:[ribosomal protein S5]-alanine N-acetyltransferase